MPSSEMQPPQRTITPAARFSTHALRPHSRLNALRTHLDQVVQPGELRGDKPLARVELIGAASGWGVARIETSPVAVVHGPEHVTARPAGYLVWLQLNGSSFFRQGSGAVEARPGTLVVRGAACPSEVCVTRTSEGILIRVPEQHGDRRLARAVGLREDDGAGRVLREFIIGLATRSLHDASETLDCATVTLSQLLQTGLRSATAAAGAAYLDTMLADIEARLHEPGLCALSVAERAGVSLRTLHRVLSDAGLSFRQYVLERRLERCRTDLGNDPQASITEVSLRWGFNDLSHFCRTFKKHFGITPSAHRR